MSLTGILLLFAIAAMSYGAFCAIKARKDHDQAGGSGHRTSLHPKLHLLDETQYRALMAEKHGHVLFHLQPTDRPSSESIGISVQELEKCLPWVPGKTNVVILTKGGFGPTVLDRLREFHTKRDLFLVEKVH